MSDNGLNIYLFMNIYVANAYISISMFILRVLFFPNLKFKPKIRKNISHVNFLNNYQA